MSSVAEIDTTVEQHVLSYTVDHPLFINEPSLFRPILKLQQSIRVDVPRNINTLHLVLIRYILTLAITEIELSDIDDKNREIVSIYQQIISIARTKIEYMLETHDDRKLILENTITFIKARKYFNDFNDSVWASIVPMLIPKQPIVDEFICPLSLDLVTAKNDIYRYVLPCGHQFSKEIKKWKHNTCPMCRQAIL